jgi:hypothetical protein
MRNLVAPSTQLSLWHLRNHQPEFHGSCTLRTWVLTLNNNMWTPTKSHSTCPRTEDLSATTTHWVAPTRSHSCRPKGHIHGSTIFRGWMMTHTQINIVVWDCHHSTPTNNSYSLVVSQSIYFSYGYLGVHSRHLKCHYSSHSVFVTQNTHKLYESLWLITLCVMGNT